MKSTKFKVLGSILNMAAVAGFALSAGATTTQRTVSSISIKGTSYVVISVNGAAITGRPSCHDPSSTNAYAFDISTDKGKAMLTLAQAAILAGKLVGIHGGTTCTNLGTYSLETITQLDLSQ